MQFENLTYKDGEGVVSVNIRLMAIVNDFEVLDDPVTVQLSRTNK